MKYKIFVWLFLLLGFSAIASGRQLLTGPFKQYPSIKQALNQSLAGDTVLVFAGTYKEGNIIIDKPIYFKGTGNPVIDGELKYEVLSVKSPNVIVEGFTIRNSGHGSLDDPGGIKVYASNNVIIQNNKIENNFFGIYIQYSKHCLIRNNYIISNATDEQLIGNGIHCWKSDSLQITSNEIQGHRDGIYFEFVTNSDIFMNHSKNNIRYGLHFMFSNNDSYVLNTFTGNGAGVAVMFTKNVKMFHNVFEQNWGDAAYGLLLKEISDSQIAGNKFISNTSGIYMEGTNRIIVTKNSFHQNGWGMRIQASCMDNIVTKNNFTANTFDITTNGSLVLNNFDGNYWDKYEGYDLNKDKKGDVPYHPISLFSVIVEMNPPAMLLYRSIIVSLLDKSEKLIPSLTPDLFRDSKPLMRAIEL
ncbi:MAG: nitrous oxide reductase family maturation protein NosD [Bacteroidetes bacterium]|nr:nitrous oxide reductase family maturation protein NosD [Bacteroidota bacterium]